MANPLDLHWMQAALALAERAAAAGEVPVGAVVVHEGQIVGQGWNQPVSAADPSAHAEVLALRDAARTLNNYRLADCDLYVTLEPCTMCVGAIMHARIRRLVFAAAEPKAGVVESNGQLLGASHFNHSVQWESGVCADEASDLLQTFFRKRRDAKRAEKSQKIMQIVSGSDGKLRLFTNNAEHLPGFVKLNEAWIQRYFTLEDIDRLIAQNSQKIINDGGYIFSLERQKKVVGVCALFKKNESLYEVARMAVAPEEQGKGYSRLLMNALLEKAQSLGAKRLRLLSNTKLESAIALYKKYGFVATATGEHPLYKRCNIVMEREI